MKKERGGQSEWSQEPDKRLGRLETHPENEAEHGVLDTELGLGDALQLALLACLLPGSVARVLHTRHCQHLASRDTPHTAHRTRTATLEARHHHMQKPTPDE